MAQLLAGWANQIAARYGHPVYLVGSALEKEHPRDVDIVVVLPDDEFTNRFDRPDHCWRLGSESAQTEGAKRLFAEIAKVARQCAQYHQCINVDFKIYAASEAAKHDGKPKLRIDTVQLGET